MISFYLTINYRAHMQYTQDTNDIRKFKIDIPTSFYGFNILHAKFVNELNFSAGKYQKKILNELKTCTFSVNYPCVHHDELNPTSALVLDSFSPLKDIGHWTS